MQPSVELRPTRADDLDRVLLLERDPENVPFLGQWSRAEPFAAIARRDRQHWIIECPAAAPEGNIAGYLIAYDLFSSSLGVYVKRLVIADKSRGLGRAALEQFTRRTRRDGGDRCVWLTVFADNQRAQRCYAAAGFRIAPLADEHRQALYGAVGGFSDRSLVMALAGVVPGG